MDVREALTEYIDLFKKVSTFVSIDVASSTTLKNGENEQDVIYSFLSYHKLIRALAYTHHGEVTSISGDGIMCRFERADDAVTAVVQILSGLTAFNKRQNRLSRPFALRLGVNTGQVYESQSMAAGQIISHTIDVAAKLQQSAPTNQARISQETLTALKDVKLALTRVGWDPNLKTTVYQYSGETNTRIATRVLPSPLRLMVLDDELLEVVRLKKALWDRRYEWMSAYDSAQAAQCVQIWRPHVIFLNTDMPWDAGWDTLKSLREDKTGSQIPVLLMSSQSSMDDVERGFALGGNGILNKPLVKPQVVKRLDVALREFYL